MLAKLSERSVDALTQVICGDGLPEGVSAPYRSGPDLIKFFNEFGEHDRYADGFGTRNVFAREKISKHNGTPTLVPIVENALDPLTFREHGLPLQPVLDYLGPYFRRDDLDVKVAGDRTRITSLSDLPTVVSLPAVDSAESYSAVLAEFVDRGNHRVSTNDFKGAVTIARSIAEAALLRARSELLGADKKYDGDLPKLYKEVSALLNLDPGAAAIPKDLRPILGGLSAIIAGLAPYRNANSDAHATTRRVARHHALLALNSARTLAGFIVDTLDYQRSRLTKQERKE